MQPHGSHAEQSKSNSLPCFFRVSHLMQATLDNNAHGHVVSSRAVALILRVDACRELKTSGTLSGLSLLHTTRECFRTWSGVAYLTGAGCAVL